MRDTPKVFQEIGLNPLPMTYTQAHLKEALLKKLDNWKNFKPIRGKKEDFFKLLKQGLNLKEIHKYTPKYC